VNQEKIHEYIFENPETYKKAVIITNTKDDNERFFISMKLQDEIGEDLMLLDDCCLEGSPYSLELKYFISLLDLFADMCQGRNYVCNETIREWFPITALRYNIWNTNLNKDIRAAFCRLMLNLYIDSYPRENSKRPELCRILGTGNVAYTNTNMREMCSKNFSLLASDHGIFEQQDSQLERRDTTSIDEQNSSAGSA
jgi:hypothetical protein